MPNTTVPGNNNTPSPESPLRKIYRGFVLYLPFILLITIPYIFYKVSKIK